MKFNIQAVEGTKVVAFSTADNLPEALRLFAEKVELVMREHEKAAEAAWHARRAALEYVR
jgi:hypothetical protein